MQVGELIRAVGGNGRVAERVGCSASAVSQWRSSGIPREHYLMMWRMALEAGIAWEPPGADAIRHLLDAASPADRKVA